MKYPIPHKKHTLKKIGITYGILTGLAVVGYLLIFYFFEKSSFRGLTATWSCLIIYLIGMFLAASAARKEVTEDLSLYLIQVTMIVWLITNAIYYLFFYGMMMYDAELLQMHQQMTHSDMLEFYKNRADYLQDIKKNTLDTYTPTIRGSIFPYAIGIIGGFVFSLIISEIVKRLQLSTNT